ncbi:hypothetical protein GUJ93_ZPchr0008g13729 [Zizania palustris]|uniref:Ubiquitinyl hydrolase 1 n=1 Tax=Zizania palustris TaxID=103762 RepID=A0A8J5RZR3_ZIZPA|nr:hypothetical protein GUJ93_ZPchr0008g13729 [Zizania palustris]
MGEEKSAGERETGKTSMAPPRDKVAAPTSNADETCCHFDRSEDDMVILISMVLSYKFAPRCEHYLCENKVEHSSILVCMDCHMHFCIGEGTKNNPQGHARGHANQEQHLVALWLDEPEVLYCFVCERCLNLDVSEEEKSISSDESEHCEHFTGDDLEFALILSEIISFTNDPTCHHFACSIAGRNNIMVCATCKMHLCTRAEANKRPQGHAKGHAWQFGHWVGLWYSDPYQGYCFLCANTLSLGDKNGIVVDDEADTDSRPRPSGSAKGHDCLIRGIPNFGNTCYFNALLQCLFVLGKLRAWMLGPDVPSGLLGLILKDLFLDANDVDNAGRDLDPTKLLGCVRMLDPRFAGSDMQDSHELLCTLRDGLGKETMTMRPEQHDGDPSAVAPTVIDYIFGGQLSVTTSCRCCSYSSASHEVIYDISAPLPSERPPPKSIVSPPKNISCRSREKICIKLFPEIDMTNTQIVQAIVDGSDSDITGLEMGDVFFQKEMGDVFTEKIFEGLEIGKFIYPVSK